MTVNRKAGRAEKEMAKYLEIASMLPCYQIQIV